MHARPTQVQSPSKRKPLPAYAQPNDKTETAPPPRAQKPQHGPAPLLRSPPHRPSRASLRPPPPALRAISRGAPHLAGSGGEGGAQPPHCASSSRRCSGGERESHLPRPRHASVGDASKLHLGRTSAAPRPHLGRTSAAPRPHLGRISAASRLSEPPLHARPLVFAWQRPRAADVVPARAPRRESSHSRLAATRLARHQPTIGFPRFFSGRLHATRAQRCHGVSCWQSGPQRRGLSPDPQLSRLDRLPTHAAAGAVCLRPLHAGHRRLVTARAVRRKSLAPSALSPPPPPLIRLPVRARAPARVLQRVVAVRVVVLLSPAHAAARPLAAVGGRLPDFRRTCHARVTDSSRPQTAR